MSVVANHSANDSLLRRIELGKSQRDIQQTREEKRKEEVETSKKRTVVLGLVANSLSADNNVRNKIRKNEKDSGKGTGKKRKRESESEYRRTEVVEIEDIPKSEESKDSEEDGDVSWPQLFAAELIKINKLHCLQEEDIPMLPNTFFKELSQH